MATDARGSGGRNRCRRRRPGLCRGAVRIRRCPARPTTSTTGRRRAHRPHFVAAAAAERQRAAAGRRARDRAGRPGAGPPPAGARDRQRQHAVPRRFGQPRDHRRRANASTGCSTRSSTSAATRPAAHRSCSVPGRAPVPAGADARVGHLYRDSTAPARASRADLVATLGPRPRRRARRGHRLAGDARLAPRHDTRARREPAADRAARRGRGDGVPRMARRRPLHPARRRDGVARRAAARTPVRATVSACAGCCRRSMPTRRPTRCGASSMSPEPLLITKSATVSTVHRRVNPDLSSRSRPSPATGARSR